MSAMQFRTIESPVGPLTLAGEGRNLMHLSMVDPTHEPSHSGWERDDKASSDSRREFDLELDLVGTSFQRRVWEALGLVAGLYAASSVALAELLLGCSRQRRRTSASGGRPLLGRSRDHVVIGALTAALLEWANDPDAGPMGNAVTAALALLEIQPPK